jgi:hypothetical protein
LYPELAALARRATGSGSIPGWFEDWLEAEGEAQALLIWAPMNIPGLFQTPEYARALFLADQTRFTGTRLLSGARSWPACVTASSILTSRAA